MTGDIIIVLIILAMAVVLFVTEWVRYDGVAILVLLALAIAGSVPMASTITGFASPAVVTIAAVLVMSGGLYKTGVANLIGLQVMRLAGDSYVRVTVLLMMTVGILSGLMNNTAATALLLPVVLDISRRLAISPSRLLIPLSFGALLGGMTTLIGTGPNILLSSVLERAGLGSFSLFNFTPVGAAALLTGVAYMVFAGWRLLPDHSRADEPADRTGSRPRYNMSKALFTVTLPDGSSLAGRSLIDARLGRALGFNLLAVRRRGRMIRAPGPAFILKEGDLLVIEGERESLERLRRWGSLASQSPQDESVRGLARGSTTLVEAEIAAGSELVGESVLSLDFRNRYHSRVVAIRRGDETWSSAFEAVTLEAGDFLLLTGQEDRLRQLEEHGGFSSVIRADSETAEHRFDLSQTTMQLRVPEGSILDGQTLAATRLRRAFDFTVIAIQRAGDTIALPAASEKLRAGDVLVTECPPGGYSLIEALQALVPEDAGSALEELESEKTGFAEVTLAPASDLVGKTLHNIFFRESYGLNLLSVWRGGVAIHSGILVQRMALKFGDALLVYGPRKKIALLARDPRFLVLSSEVREHFRTGKAPVASLLMLGFIIVSSLNLVPVYIAALAGALLMVFTGCVRGNEVYPQIEWRVIVLLGGMLALGLAMEESGTAQFIAREVVGRAAEMGPRVLIASLFLLCGLAAQFVPTSAVAVLVAPIALSAASELDISPQALLMVVAVGSSCAFLSPFGHPVNLLVMNVGGYKVTDYTRVGAPLFVLLMLLVVFFLPVVWPL